MHAILTPIGSAGDINPFVVVGGALRRRGHRVTLLAPEVFAGVAANAGLDFVAVGTTGEFDAATRNPDLWDPRRGPKIVFSEVAAHLQDGYDAIVRLYEPGETMLVGHTLSFPTRVFEETHPVPAATVHLAPGVFRSDFRQAVLPSGGDLSSWPRWAKRVLWWVVDRVGIDPLIAPALNRWRSGLALPPVSRVLRSWMHSPQRVLGLFPDWFGDRQPDWPPQLTLTGFVLSDTSCAPSTVPAGDALEQYLAVGEPPVVFTPGSANRHAVAFFEAAVEATRRIRRRALFVTAYREQLPASLPVHVHHAGYASFSTLFPRAAAVVHHGGIGTCAQAFAAGVPQVIMPMGFDQPDNAARASRLGVAEVVPLARFTASNVAAALDRLLSSERVRSRCRHWRDAVGHASGVSTACDLIEQQHAAFARTARVGESGWTRATTSTASGS